MDGAPLPPILLQKEFANKFLRDYRTVVPHGHRLERDPLAFLSAMESSTEELLNEELIRHDGIKYSTMLTVEFERSGPKTDNNEANNIITTTAYFRYLATKILNTGETRGAVQAGKAKILKHLEGFTREGSGWRVKRVVALDIGTARFKPYRAQSYFPTPRYLPPRTVVNVQNEDNRCFEWAVLSAMYPVEKNPQRPSKYLTHLNELNFDKIAFPVKVTDIDRFERQNLTISVNVFGWNKGLYPIHISNNIRDHNVDLLMLADGENQHYVWIKNLARMLHKNDKNNNKKHPCRRCLHPFSRQDLLDLT